jgi:hypothetical protein
MNFAVDAVDAVGGLIDAETHHPTYTGEVVQTVDKQFSHFANVDGEHGGVMLDTFMSSGALVARDAVGVTTSETDVGDLLGRLCWLDTFSVDSEQIPGTIVYRGPLTISPHIFAAPVGTPFVPTLQGFIAATHDYWRCDLEYVVEIIAPKVTTIRLFFGIIYGGVVTPVSLSDVTANYGAVIDFNAENALAIIRVPFRAPVDMLRVPRPGEPDPGTSTLGEFGIWVLNPYVGNPTVSDRADVNIHMRCVPSEGTSRVELTYLGGSVSEFIPL